MKTKNRSIIVSNRIIRMVGAGSAGMRQRRSKCKVLGRARKPSPTRVCRGNSLWSPLYTKFDFDTVPAGSKPAPSINAVAHRTPNLVDKWITTT